MPPDPSQYQVGALWVETLLTGTGHEQLVVQAWAYKPVKCTVDERADLVRNLTQLQAPVGTTPGRYEVTYALGAVSLGPHEVQVWTDDVRTHVAAVVGDKPFPAHDPYKALPSMTERWQREADKVGAINQVTDKLG